jgi:nicotinate dehydrogenase large molybdopterin subunit
MEEKESAVTKKSKPVRTRKSTVVARPLEAVETPRLAAVTQPVTYPIEALVPKIRQQMPAVGQRATRPDARLHGLGQTKYIDDISFPGMLYCKIKRAGIASALIRKIDTREAEAMPGVMAVITGKDIPVNSFGPSITDQPVLALERVFHAGDGVAAVAAVTEQIALEALDKIKVEYEALPAVFDPAEAMKDSAPKVHPPSSNIYATKLIKKGDVDQGFRDSYRIFENTYSTQMVEHVSIEPHCSIAAWDANGRLTIHSTLGRITLGRTDMARTLQLPISRIRMVATIVGGNFGGKNEITQEPALAVLSKKTGRPVKGTFTRAEEFIATTTRHPVVMHYKTGVSKEGKILARKVRLLLDGGAYCSWSETTLGKACILAPGPYDIDNVHSEAFVVYTNKTMTGAMRGFGAPQVCFAYESQMDEIAEALCIDPLEIRMRNAFSEGSSSPTGQVLHSVVVRESLMQAAERYGWKGAQR